MLGTRAKGIQGEGIQGGTTVHKILDHALSSSLNFGRRASVAAFGCHCCCCCTNLSSGWKVVHWTGWKVVHWNGRVSLFICYLVVLLFLSSEGGLFLITKKTTMTVMKTLCLHPPCWTPPCWTRNSNGGYSLFCASEWAFVIGLKGVHRNGHLPEGHSPEGHSLCCYFCHWKGVCCCGCRCVTAASIGTGVCHWKGIHPKGVHENRHLLLEGL